MKTLWDDLQAHFKARGFDLFTVERKKKNAIHVVFRSGPDKFYTLDPYVEVPVPPGVTPDELDAALCQEAKVRFEEWRREREAKRS